MNQAAALTTSVTVEPAVVVASGNGFCEITKPGGTFESANVSMLTSRCARFNAASASLRVRGGWETLGTVTRPPTAVEGVVAVVDDSGEAVVDVVVGAFDTAAESAA